MYKSLFVFSLFLLSVYAYSQETTEGVVTGSLQTDMQYYREDSLIGAPKVPEYLLMNTYANFTYTKGKFSAGVRFESYLNTLQGFDSRNNGTGIPYKWARYATDEFDFTVGNFYEQFGSGLIFRSYEEKSLGYDNAMDGLRIKYKPIDGIYLTGIIGKQRAFFQEDTKGFSYLKNGQGLVRGLDAEFYFNDIISSLSEKKLRISLGESVVSKYQQDKDPIYNLPENVSAFSSRLNVNYGKVSLSSEYVYKINDPSMDNNYIYKNGQALLLNASYSQKGLGIYLSAKRVDNMSFRSDRDASLSNLNINYIPLISKTHTYSLAAMYPYASQPNGEMGFQGEVMYKIKKESKLGGKYGTNISVNFSTVFDIDRTALNDSVAVGETGTLGYNTDFFSVGDEPYFQDFNIEISKKISKKFSFSFDYLNIFYNYNVIRGMAGHESIFANIFIADLNYKINSKNSVRTEIQSLFTEQENGNWLMGLVEYSIAPHWFFSVLDQYNYGNPVDEKKIHYYSGGIGFVKNSTRIQMSYGKQREGILCVGGVCRNVPASNGLTLSITSSF